MIEDFGITASPYQSWRTVRKVSWREMIDFDCSGNHIILMMVVVCGDNDDNNDNDDSDAKGNLYNN